MSNPFLFISEPFDFSDQKQVQLSTGYILRQPTVEETSAIRKFLTSVSSVAEATAKDYYEKAPPPQGEAESRPLPLDQWRYAVIESPPLHAEPDFLIALSLSDLSMTPLVEITVQNTSTLLYGFQIIPTVVAISEQGHASVRNSKDIHPDQLAYLAEMRQAVTSKMPSDIIRGAMESFRELGQFKKKSFLRLLGYFAILEGLLAHSPTGDYDSITHQFATKYPLLNRRFSKPIVLTQFFSQGSEQKILKQLYALRSQIAHGSAVDFAQTHKLLGDHLNVIAFLDLFTRRLLALLLRDEALVTDLKQV